MQYGKVTTGKFVTRPNRFVAHVEVDGQLEVCHVKNTGRCKELFLPGVTTYLEIPENPNRKTKYSVVAVEKSGRLVNIDSQAPNKVVGEYLSSLFSDIIQIKPESTYGRSRFDFYVETSQKKIYIEVKGATLEEDGIVMFPDAPTERGVKHVMELCDAKSAGFDAYVIFVIQMKGVEYFTPNITTHAAFGHALKQAHQCGVEILAFDCDVTPDSLKIANPVEVRLEVNKIDCFGLQ